MKNALTLRSNRFVPVRHKPEQRVGFRFGIWWFVCLIAMGVIFHVPAGIFCSAWVIGMIIAWHFPHPHIWKYMCLRPPLRPIFLLDSSPSPLMGIASLNGVRMLLVQIESFMPPLAKDRWIEFLAKELERKIRIVKTTGMPHAHDSKQPRYTEKMICIELKDDDEPNQLFEKTKEFLESSGIDLAPIDSATFASAAAHGWYFTHFYCQELGLGIPLAERLDSMSRIGPVDHTIVVALTVDSSDHDLSLAMSADLFIYSDDKRTAYALVANNHEHNLRLLARGKMSFVAALVRMPLEFMQVYEWHKPALIERPYDSGISG